MNYADVGRNRGGKPTKAMAASTELAATNNKVIISRASQMLTQLQNGGDEIVYLYWTEQIYLVI